jgi:hypothetical protein
MPKSLFYAPPTPQIQLRPLRFYNPDTDRPEEIFFNVYNSFEILWACKMATGLGRPGFRMLNRAQEYLMQQAGHGSFYLRETPWRKKLWLKLKGRFRV